MSANKDIKLLEDGVIATGQEGDSRRVSASIAIDPAAERRLVWKFDLRILPTLAVMYLFNSLDKSNLGNAKTAGLEKTLGLVGNDYNLILSIFFIPYVLTAPFLGIAGKKWGPANVLPIMMFSFGTCTLLVVAVQNFGGLLALRWFLGMAESAFFPVSASHPLVIFDGVEMLTAISSLSTIRLHSIVGVNSPAAWPSSMQRHRSHRLLAACSRMEFSKSTGAVSPIGDTCLSSKAAAPSYFHSLLSGISPEMPRAPNS